jgi:hypothetical protein
MAALEGDKRGGSWLLCDGCVLFACWRRSLCASNLAGPCKSRSNLQLDVSFRVLARRLQCIRPRSQPRLRFADGYLEVVPTMIDMPISDPDKSLRRRTYSIL